MLTAKELRVEAAKWQAHGQSHDALLQDGIPKPTQYAAACYHHARVCSDLAAQLEKEQADAE